MFIAIKHSLRITTSYLCRVGGEYNTRKGNNPGRLLAVYEPLGALLWVNIVNIQKESEMANQISTQTVSFNNQSLITIEQNGTHYTAMKPICENIGLDWKSQYSRMKRDDVLNSVIFIMNMTGSDSKNYQIGYPNLY